MSFSHFSVEDLQAQMLEMQRQMMIMQKQLEEKNQSPSQNSFDNKKSTNGIDKPKGRPKNVYSLSEVDLFSQPGTSSKDCPKSPVKTNPFAEGIDRKVQFPSAKIFYETPNFGPALSKKVTRTIENDEKSQLLKQLSMRDKERKENNGLTQIEIASRDLECSSDEDVDEEGNRITLSRYSAYGNEIKRQISRKAHQGTNNDHAPLNRSKATENITSVQPLKKANPTRVDGFNQLKGSTMNLSTNSANVRLPLDVITEKHSRIRISKPLINQTQLDLALVGRKFVPLYRIKAAITMRETEGDWTTIGVIYYKTSATSKNGNAYTRWSITDLVGDIQTVSVMLFGKAQAKYYSMPQNRVVGILNPKILEDRSGKGEISLSIDNPDKILEMGESVDVGKCAARKNDGTGCTNLVNINSCEYCTFHVKKAYKAISSKRGEIQSAFSGTDSRSRIMQKIAPKADIFAGGQLLNARVVNGKVSAKQKSKDTNTLSKLGVTMLGKGHLMSKRNNPIHDGLFFEKDEKAKERISKLDTCQRQAVKKVATLSEDLGKRMLDNTPGSKALMRHLVNAENEKLEKQKKKLKDSGKTNELEGNSKSAVKDVKGLQLFTIDEEHELQKKRMLENQKGAQKLLLEQKLKNKQEIENKKPNIFEPKLGRGISSNELIDLNVQKKLSGISADKAKALLALKGKSIKKQDPNYVSKRKRSEESVEQSQKRVALSLEDKSDDENEERVKDPSSDTLGGTKKINKDKVVMSFTGEILDKKRIEELKNKKSSRSHLADEAELQDEEYYFDRLQKKEAMEDKVRFIIKYCRILNQINQIGVNLC